MADQNNRPGFDWRATLRQQETVHGCDRVIEEFLRHLGHGDMADLWREQVRSADDAAAPCRTCGAVPGTPDYGTVGDGYDGLCPSCADKEQAKLDAEMDAFDARWAAHVTTVDAGSDPWHIGELPGDELRCTIRDQNGLAVRVASSADIAERMVNLHNAKESADG
jgi:hypothetical protein